MATEQAKHVLVWVTNREEAECSCGLWHMMATGANSDGRILVEFAYHKHYRFMPTRGNLTGKAIIH